MATFFYTTEVNIAPQPPAGQRLIFRVPSSGGNRLEFRLLPGEHFEVDDPVAIEAIRRDPKIFEVT